jgi:hypothetical protein
MAVYRVQHNRVSYNMSSSFNVIIGLVTACVTVYLVTRILNHYQHVTWHLMYEVDTLVVIWKVDGARMAQMIVAT